MIYAKQIQQNSFSTALEPQGFQKSKVDIKFKFYILQEGDVNYES